MVILLLYCCILSVKIVMLFSRDERQEQLSDSRDECEENKANLMKLRNEVFMHYGRCLSFVDFL